MLLIDNLNFKDARERPGESEGVIMTKNITKEQIEKIIELKGSFYAKSTRHGRYYSSITYNDLRIEYDRDGVLTLTLFCNKVEDDTTVDEKTFRLIDGKWIEYFEYSSIQSVPVENIDKIWIIVLNADDEFCEYARHLLKLFAE